jgi:hypothetical protein
MVDFLREALMKRTEVLEGMRMISSGTFFGRCEEGGLSKLEAAELLGVNESPLVSAL